MKRIAVIADVHGNVPALEAVLADLASQAVDEVLVGGDLVGRGPEGAKVSRAIRERAWPCVRGNHEDYVLAFRAGDVPEEWRHSEEWAASRWMAAELDDEDVRYLDSMPLSRDSAEAPGLHLVHGSPRSHSEGLGPWTSDAELERHLDAIDGSALVCGHTHRPMLRRFPSGLVVNVGAVGLPFNGDRRAQYGIVERRDGQWSVELRQVPYDVERALEIYETSGFLAEGGVTARLLRMELENAAPFLVPFIRWARAKGVPVESGRVDDFLEFYRPGESLRGFFERLSALGASQ